MKRELILIGTHFEVLGVGPQADASEVANAYRLAVGMRRTWWGRLGLLISRGCTGSALADAHRVLSDPDARASYVATLWQRQRCPVYLNPYL